MLLCSYPHGAGQVVFIEAKSKAPTPAEVGAFFMLSKLEPFLIAAIAKCS